MKAKALLLLYFLSLSLILSACPLPSPPSGNDTIGRLPNNHDDEIRINETPRKGNIFKQFFQAFNAMDTTYITPNKYNWAFMLQNTNSYETYTLHNREQGQKMSFSPQPAVKRVSSNLVGIGI